MKMATRTGYTGFQYGQRVCGTSPPTQGDNLMGRNAYYVTGQRSKTLLPGRHLRRLSPATDNAAAAFSGGSLRTNHSFNTSLPSAQVPRQLHRALSRQALTRVWPNWIRIRKAVYRLKNAGSDPPAGTTIVITHGSTPRISINGARRHDQKLSDRVAGITDATILTSQSELELWLLSSDSAKAFITRPSPLLCWMLRSPR